MSCFIFFMLGNIMKRTPASDENERNTRDGMSRIKENQNCCSVIDTWQPVTVAERCRACTVFARSEAGIVGSNPT
jgi:hypothetical protein